MFEMSPAVDLLFAALSKALPKIPKIEKSGTNPQFKSKYMILDDILEVVMPVLKTEGLFIVQGMATAPNGDQGVTTAICHASGQFISQTAFGKNLKAGPQQDGGLVTYYRRYQLGAMLGLCTETDDDANGVQKEAEKVNNPERQYEADYQPANNNYQSSQSRPFSRDRNFDYKKITEPQAKRLFAISKSRGWYPEQVREILLANFNIHSTADLTREPYDILIRHIETTDPGTPMNVENKLPNSGELNPEDVPF